MASFTAQILIGNGGGYDNEGIIPDSTLFLSENSRPAWVLKYRGRKITWIPTLDNMLEDGLLMLAIFVLKDPELVELAQEYFHNKEVNKAALYDDIRTSPSALSKKSFYGLEVQAYHLGI